MKSREYISYVLLFNTYMLIITGYIVQMNTVLSYKMMKEMF